MHRTYLIVFRCSGLWRKKLYTVLTCYGPGSVTNYGPAVRCCKDTLVTRTKPLCEA